MYLSPQVLLLVGSIVGALALVLAAVVNYLSKWTGDYLARLAKCEERIIALTAELDEQLRLKHEAQDRAQELELQHAVELQKLRTEHRDEIERLQERIEELEAQLKLLQEVKS